MDEILNERIKAIIERYPAVGDVLNEFGVACTSCAVGTCLLKDILDIHRLSAEDEQRLIQRIAGIVYPKREIVIPLREKARSAQTKAPACSPPIQRLVNEHKLIKRLLALIPGLADRLDLAAEADRRSCLSAVDFIRAYADKYHHAKEEDILFKLFDEKLDIIQAMLTDHETGRGHVRAVVEAVERRDTSAAADRLLAYGELLTEHIKKEDEVLYPWLDRQLSDTQVGRLFAQFAEVDETFRSIPREQEKWIEQMEAVS